MDTVAEGRARSRVVGLPGWWATVLEAERAIRATVRELEAVTACTHTADGIALVTAEVPAQAGSRRPSDTADRHRWPQRLREAVLDHESRYGGRLFVFAGSERLRGTMTIEEILAATAIDEVVVPGHPGPIAVDTPVGGLDHVRPVYRQGQLVLTLRPDLRGGLVPFEQRRCVPIGRLNI